MLTADRVIARRHTVLIVLRMSGSALLVVGTITLLYAAITTAVVVAISRGFRTIPVQSLAFGVATVVPAIMLLWLDRRIVRWLVPIPRAECPRCGYRLHERPAQCPECGLVLRMEERT